MLSIFEQRYRPSKPIELGALATHHIYDEELVHCPPSSDFVLPATTRYIIGHNVDYDWAVAGRPPVKRICTLALARYFYPDIDSHNQSAMLYLICRPEARERLRNAHSALADVQNCHTVLYHLIQRAGSIHSWDDLGNCPSTRACRAPCRLANIGACRSPTFLTTTRPGYCASPTWIPI